MTDEPKQVEATPEEDDVTYVVEVREDGDRHATLGVVTVGKRTHRRTVLVRAVETLPALKALAEDGPVNVRLLPVADLFEETLSLAQPPRRLVIGGA